MSSFEFTKDKILAKVADMFSDETNDKNVLKATLAYVKSISDDVQVENSHRIDLKQTPKPPDYSLFCEAEVWFDENGAERKDFSPFVSSEISTSALSEIQRGIRYAANSAEKFAHFLKTSDISSEDVYMSISPLISATQHGYSLVFDIFTHSNNEHECVEIVTDFYSNFFKIFLENDEFVATDGEVVGKIHRVGKYIVISVIEEPKFSSVLRKYSSSSSIDN